MHNYSILHCFFYFRYSSLLFFLSSFNLSRIDFNSFVLDIWRDQLPNIYVNNYQMKQATEGIELLQTIE